MKDMYYVFRDPETGGGDITRMCGTTGASKRLLEHSELTLEQGIEVYGTLIETYERGFQHAIKVMKDYLEGKEIHNVRPRPEGSEDSDSFESILPSCMDSDQTRD